MFQGGAGGSISHQIEKDLASAGISDAESNNRATNAERNVGVTMKGGSAIGIIGQHDFADSRLSNILSQLPRRSGPG